MANIETPAPAEKRQHKLNTQEIRALWTASKSLPLGLERKHEEFGIGLFWRLSLMLMQRRGELAGMRWQEVDLFTAEWIIPGSRTKNGRDHLVPLPTQAVEELKSLSSNRKPDEYVFGKFPDAPFSGFSKAKRELERAMVCENLRPWRIHDLRRTGASLMSGVRVQGRKVQPHIIEAILNHTPSTLEATYQVWDLHRYADEKKEALQAWADHLDLINSNQDSHANPTRKTNPHTVGEWSA